MAFQSESVIPDDTILFMVNLPYLNFNRIFCNRDCWKAMSYESRGSGEDTEGSNLLHSLITYVLWPCWCFNNFKEHTAFVWGLHMPLNTYMCLLAIPFRITPVRTYRHRIIALKYIFLFTIPWSLVLKLAALIVLVSLLLSSSVKSRVCGRWLCYPNHLQTVTYKTSFRNFITSFSMLSPGMQSPWC